MLRNLESGKFFQWYDGITPQYHWDLEEDLEERFASEKLEFVKTQSGCYRVTV